MVTPQAVDKVMSTALLYGKISKALLVQEYLSWGAFYETLQSSAELYVGHCKCPMQCLTNINWGNKEVFMSNSFTKEDLSFLVEAMDRKAKIHNTMILAEETGANDKVSGDMSIPKPLEVNVNAR